MSKFENESGSFETHGSWTIETQGTTKLAVFTDVGQRAVYDLNSLQTAVANVKASQPAYTHDAYQDELSHFLTGLHLLKAALNTP